MVRVVLIIDHWGDFTNVLSHIELLSLIRVQVVDENVRLAVDLAAKRHEILETVELSDHEFPVAEERRVQQILPVRFLRICINLRVS